MQGTPADSDYRGFGESFQKEVYLNGASPMASMLRHGAPRHSHLTVLWQLLGVQKTRCLEPMVEVLQQTSSSEEMERTTAGRVYRPDARYTVSVF